VTSRARQRDQAAARRRARRPGWL